MAPKGSSWFPDPKRTNPAFPFIPASAIIGVTDLVRTIEIAVGLATVASVALIPAGARVLRSCVDVQTAYSAGATIAVTCGATSLQTAAESTPQTIDEYEKLQRTAVAATAVVTVTVAGAPAVGAARVLIEYAVPLP